MIVGNRDGLVGGGDDTDGGMPSCNWKGNIEMKTRTKMKGDEREG